MANPRRSQKVSQQILRELSTLILTDKRARCAHTSHVAAHASGSSPHALALLIMRVPALR